MAKLEVAELYTKLTADNKPFLAGMKQAELGLRGVGNTGLRVFAGITRAALVAGAAIGGLALAGAGASLKLAADWEDAQRAFKTFLGSESAAKSFMAEMRDFAKATPFDLPGIMSAARQMLAFRFEVGEIIPMLTVLGDAAAGLNLGSAGIERLVTALGQMKNRTKVSAEEMNQLIQAGIDGWGILSDGMGKTTAELMKMGEAGQLSSLEAIPILLAGIGKQFKGLMSEQSTGLRGLWSTLKDTMSMVLTDIGTKIAAELDLRGVMDKSIKWLEANKGRLVQWGAEIVKVFGKVLIWCKNVAIGLVAAANAAIDWQNAMVANPKHLLAMIKWLPVVIGLVQMLAGALTVAAGAAMKSLPTIAIGMGLMATSGAVAIGAAVGYAALAKTLLGLGKINKIAFPTFDGTTGDADGGTTTPKGNSIVAPFTQTQLDAAYAAAIEATKENGRKVFELHSANAKEVRDVWRRNLDEAFEDKKSRYDKLGVNVRRAMQSWKMFEKPTATMTSADAAEIYKGILAKRQTDYAEQLTAERGIGKGRTAAQSEEAYVRWQTQLLDAVKSLGGRRVEA